jgi:hypothetical protein
MVMVLWFIWYWFKTMEKQWQDGPFMCLPIKACQTHVLHRKGVAFVNSASVQTI